MPLHIGLLVVFIGVILLDLLFAWLCLKKHSGTGTSLGMACLGAALVTTSYLVSVFVQDYFVFSVLSSIYFIGNDLTLLALACFVRHFVLRAEKGRRGIGWRVLFAWAVLDIMLLALNPFCEIAIRYTPVEGAISHYAYDLRLPYELHLLLAYVLLAMVLFYLVRKAMAVPSVYRRQYYYAVLTLLLVVLINAVYLYSRAPVGHPIPDYSLLGYSLAAFLLYWNCFMYTTHGLMDELRHHIFASIDQGLLLFDYENNLILENEKARELLCGMKWGSHPTIQNLIGLLEAEEADELLTLGTDGRKYSFQCYPDDGERIHPMLCDYSALLSKKGEVLGRLFVYTELSSEYDALTGFYDWEFYKKQEEKDRGKAMIVAACDINGLTDINREFGRSGGDRAIQVLARQLRTCFPAGTCFIRGREAILIAVCEGESEEAIRSYLEQMEDALKKEPFLGKPLCFQCSIKRQEASEKRSDTVRGAMDALRTRKLLDHNSRHSDVLYSLVRTLQECDKDTEAHVRRTQKLGGKLGRRLGLTEEQQSNLALLAILHDIGKIGIPLEILNKPGRLTDAEWNVLKTHVEKGYEIANSSAELKGIAEMILYHHERWDGKGYPDGLSKESIPLLSRLIAVVDAYDAMVSDRPYRSAMTFEQACQELKRCAGTQFDPAIVSEFLQILMEDAPVYLKLEERREKKEGPIMQWSSESQESLSQKVPHVHAMRYSRYIVDKNFRIVEVDEAFEQLTGYTRREVEERCLTQYDLIFEEDRADYVNVVREEAGKHSSAYIEHRIRRKDGRAVYVFCYGRPFFDSAERKERTEIIISDSTATYSVQSIIQIEHSKATKRLERWENKFRRDSLTGLLHHEAFKNDVETRLLSGEVQAMMLMMDVDRFKEYNDTYGHRAGDEFLIMVAQTLLASLRKDDFACRMGGDEFAAMLFFKNDTSRERMVERAMQICDKINLTLTSHREGGTSLSMGGAFLSEECGTFDRLYEAADHALYRSKESGRARVSF